MSEKLTEEKKANAKRAQEDEAVTKIIDGSQMEIPDAMINTQVDSMINDFANRISQQGLSVEQYMQFTGITMEQMENQMRPEALKRIQSGLVLEAVAEAEDIQIPDEDVEAEIERTAELYGMNAADMKGMIGESEKKNMKRDLAIQKAVEFIMDHVEEKEADPE